MDQFKRSARITLLVQVLELQELQVQQLELVPQELERLEQRLVLEQPVLVLLEQLQQELVEQLVVQRFQRLHRCSLFGCSLCIRW